jgi:hypothetical protein
MSLIYNTVMDNVRIIDKKSFILFPHTVEDSNPLYSPTEIIASFLMLAVYIAIVALFPSPRYQGNGMLITVTTAINRIAYISFAVYTMAFAVVCVNYYCI